MGSTWRELPFFHVLFFVSFLVSGLVINCVQLFLFVLIAKIGGNRRLFRSINYYLVYIIYSQLLFLADWWSGCRLTLHSDPETLAGLGAGHSLVLMNHHYELDWLFGWMVGDRAGVLGNCRVYVKKMIQWVPILGWAWRLSDVVFLARDWAQDQDTLREGLLQLQDYPDPMWVLLFPEGTRYTPEKYEASRQFAESRGLPVLRHCLVPRSKGFSFTVAHMDPGRVRWVYDVTLACGGSPAPTLTSALLGHPATASMYIRRFRIEEIPRDEAGSTRWLQELFIAKDALLESWREDGVLRAEGLPAHPGVELPRRLHSLAVPLAVHAAVLLPLAWLLLRQGWLGLLLAGGGFLAASAGLHYFLQLTQVHQGTDYGRRKEQ